MSCGEFVIGFLTVGTSSACDVVCGAQVVIKMFRMILVHMDGVGWTGGFGEWPHAVAAGEVRATCLTGFRAVSPASFATAPTATIGSTKIPRKSFSTPR